MGYLWKNDELKSNKHQVVVIPRLENSISPSIMRSLDRERDPRSDHLQLKSEADSSPAIIFPDGMETQSPPRSKYKSLISQKSQEKLKTYDFFNRSAINAQKILLSYFSNREMRRRQNNIFIVSQS